MQENIIKVNGVTTKVLTWGKGLAEAQSINKLILMIPGNPGVTYFYIKFLDIVFELLGYPIWIVSHAGHDYIDQKTIDSDNKVDYYTLKGQVQHKIDFVEQYVSKNTKIYFIGHSIGGYTVMEMLNQEFIKKMVIKCYLLFPTIEYMKITRNGKRLMFFTPLIKYIKFLANIFVSLPIFIRSKLLNIYMFITGVQKFQKLSLIKFVHPYVIENVLCMGKDEMDFVLERNDEILRKNKHLLKLYYGASDGWTPVSYFEKVKTEHPGLDVNLCENGFQHAFVLNTSVEVGQMVAKWISEEKQ